MSKLAEAKRQLNREIDKLKNGTRTLIGKGQDCVLSTGYSFWKLPEDIESEIETRLMLKRKKIASCINLNNAKTLVILQVSFFSLGSVFSSLLHPN